MSTIVDKDGDRRLPKELISQLPPTKGRGLPQSR